MPSQVVLDPTQEVLLAVLRTRGLSIKGLPEEKKVELRALLEYLHVESGLSLNDVAKLIGNKTSGYVSWLCRELGITPRPFEEARLKAIREKRRKYERRPFDGTDEDKAYLLGLRHGDLSVSRPWRGVVRVSTSTTHPAMSELFRSLFEPYGHVYQHPRYRKGIASFEWNLSTFLDDSFGFLFLKPSDHMDWILSRRSITLAYLAGLFDAEGSVGIYPARSSTSLNVIYYNTNLVLLQFVYKAIQGLGYRPLRPYMDKKKGFRSSGYHIEMRKDYWRVIVARFDECQGLLRELPLRHSEKKEKSALANSLVLGQSWKKTGPLVVAIRRGIKAARNAFVAEAERTFLANPRHQPKAE